MTNQKHAAMVKHRHLVPFSFSLELAFPFTTLRFLATSGEATIAGVDEVVGAISHSLVRLSSTVATIVKGNSRLDSANLLAFE